MAFEEPGSVAYLYEGDKKIAQIKVDTTVNSVIISVYFNCKVGVTNEK